MAQVAPLHQDAEAAALEFATAAVEGRLRPNDVIAFANRNLALWQATSETLDLICDLGKSLGTGRTARENMIRMAGKAGLRRHLLKPPD